MTFIYLITKFIKKTNCKTTEKDTECYLNWVPIQEVWVYEVKYTKMS